MTGKERYKQAFSVLKLPKDFQVEIDRNTAGKNRQAWRGIMVAVIAGLVLIGGGGTAYARNVGSIQRTLQLWVHGDQTDAEMNIYADGSYELQYLDENGELRERSGGGIAYEADGTERSLTEEELIEDLDGPEVEYEADGRAWVFYRDQKIEITDLFEDGICHVKLCGENGVLYLTVAYKNGYAYSANKYPSMD